VILTKWNSGLQPLQSHIKHSATKDRGSIKPASSSSLGIEKLVSQIPPIHCFVKSTSNDLTAVGITTCLPSELTSSLRIGEFPCSLLRTKNHHFAALRFPDFQRLILEFYLFLHIMPILFYFNRHI
jgi:hypothetical protein